MSTDEFLSVNLCSSIIIDKQNFLHVCKIKVLQNFTRNLQKVVGHTSNLADQQGLIRCS